MLYDKHILYKHMAFRLQREKKMMKAVIEKQNVEINQMRDIPKGTIYDGVIPESFMNEIISDIERVSFYPNRGRRLGDDRPIPFMIDENEK